MADVAAAAAAYAKLGWPVLPLHTWDGARCSCGRDSCPSPAKHPRTAHGLKEATTDLDVVVDWWRRWPDANIGLRTGDAFDVLDIDGAEGEAAIQERLIAAQALLPSETPTARTGGGGRHVLFSPTGVGNRAGLLDHVDWRGRGGYIVAPPSIHASGERYTWVVGPRAAGGLCDVADWLRTLVDPPRAERRAVPATGPRPVGAADAYVAVALDRELAELARAPEGMRNEQLNISGFNLYQLVGGGEIDEALVTDRLRTVALSIGLEPSEIDATLRSAAKAGTARPRRAPELPARSTSNGARRPADEPPPPSDSDVPPEYQPRPDSPPKRSQATELIELAERAYLYRTPEGVAYADVTIDAHRESWPVRAKGFRSWLRRLFYIENEKSPGAQALQDALGVIEGQALFGGNEHSVYTRLAGVDGRIYLDLADSKWRIVEISGDGWRVIADAPVRFRRVSSMLALPEPEIGGALTELRRFLNVTDDGWPLVAAWLIAAVRPTGPYPVLNLMGEQGAAKSTCARVLRSLIDPARAPVRAEPREPRDLAIAASNGWIVAFDNVSRLPNWLSDALCRVSTGGGFATRALYSNDEETIFDSQRPIVLNGIDELAQRSDLLDRSLLVELPRIGESQRIAESEFWRSVDTARPRMLGALLDAVAVALDGLADVKLDRLPRMADFAIWVAAAEPALRLPAGEFARLYAANRASANSLALEANVIGPAIEALLVAAAGVWRGTSSELLHELEGRVDEAERRAKDWPATAHHFSNTLRRIAPNLRAEGVTVEFERVGKQSRRVVVLKREEVLGKSASAASAASATLLDQDI